MRFDGDPPSDDEPTPLAPDTLTWLKLYREWQNDPRKPYPTPKPNHRS